MVDFTREDCVHADGTETVNYELAVRHGLTKGKVTLVKSLQMLRRITKAIVLLTDTREYNEQLTEIEYALQRAWGFSEEKQFHPKLCS